MNDEVLCGRCGSSPRGLSETGALQAYCQECLGLPAEEWRQWAAEQRQRKRGRDHAQRSLRVGVFESYVDPWPTGCGRCGCPIDPRYGSGSRHPLAESIGHEPPISWAVQNGIDVVTVRPEHWVCNSWEPLAPDHLRDPIPARLHVGHGCALDQPRQRGHRTSRLGVTERVKLDE